MNRTPEQLATAVVGRPPSAGSTPSPGRRAGLGQHRALPMLPMPPGTPTARSGAHVNRNEGVWRAPDLKREAERVLFANAPWLGAASVPCWKSADGRRAFEAPGDVLKRRIAREHRVVPSYTGLSEL